MLQLIKLWAEPPIHDLSFGARAAIHTGIWAVWLLLMEYAVLLQVKLLRKTHLSQHVSPPKLPWYQMLAHSSVGMLGWSWMLGLVAAWINPGAPDGWRWSYDCPNLLLLGYYALATLMLFDAYSYLVHRWMHSNKTAFNLLHKKHHEMKAALDASTSGYMALSEGVVSAALPICALYIIGLATGNWWYTLAAIWNSQNITMLGHCGAVVTMNDWRDLLITALNPFSLWYHMCPAHMTPMDHADHHMWPTKCFAFYFTYWDDKMGTSRHTRPPCSLLVLAAHALYQAAFYAAIYLLLTRPVTALTAWITCYVLIPPTAAAAVSEALRLPAITRALAGGLMDAYRADNCITYAAAGAPGSFTPAHTATHAPGGSGASAAAPAGPAAAAAAARDAPRQGAQPVYLFACHPAGVISRAAFCTFGARGWHSPVATLREVRLAVGSQLFWFPITCLREFLLAFGCVPADRATMARALRSGCSVAVTPGGWREGQMHGSYNLVLRQRKGFLQLAQQTGALLVPVLCLGEQDVARPPVVGPLLWGYRFLQTYRPSPVKVVFGKVVAHQAGESTEQLHSRYVEALVDLGKEHGVQLELAE